MLENLARRFPSHVIRWYCGTLLTKPYAFADFLVGVRGGDPFQPKIATDSIVTPRFKILTDPGDRLKGVSSSLRLYGTYDPELTWVVEQLIDSDSTVIDIGANIGWYTLLAASLSRAVIAFEPEPRNFGLLSKSVGLNLFQNVTLRQEVVSDHDGELNLYLSDTNRGGHSIVWKAPTSVKVNSTTLDRLVDDLSLKKIDLLKIDAESAEPAILRGFRKSLEAGFARFIVLEYSPTAWGNDRELLRRVFDLYSVYQFWRPIPLLVRRSSIDELPKSKQVMLVMERKGAQAA
jgi:FkbM family methyltransferase